MSFTAAKVFIYGYYSRLVTSAVRADPTGNTPIAARYHYQCFEQSYAEAMKQYIRDTLPTELLEMSAIAGFVVEETVKSAEAMIQAACIVGAAVLSAIEVVLYFTFPIGSLILKTGTQCPPTVIYFSFIFDFCSEL
jgi:hypothetical protein